MDQVPGTEVEQVRVSNRAEKEIVTIEVNGVEKDVAFPGQGTGARYVWDLCLYAIANGESSTYVVETAHAKTGMSKPSINSQLTYFRKDTGLELSRRVNTAKLEAKATKLAERADKKAAKLLAESEGRAERIVKLRASIEKAQARLVALEAAEAAGEADDQADLVEEAGE